MNVYVLISSILVAAAAAMLVAWGLPVLDRLTATQVRELKRRMTALGVESASVDFYMRIWVALMVIVAILLGPLMPPVAVAVIALIYVAPRLILGAIVRRRSYLLRDQMVEATLTLANSARAGMSLAQGVELVADEAPDPLRAEFRRIARDNQRGKPLPEALDDTQIRLNLDSFTLFSIAIQVCLEQGGNVVEALERISNSLQEHQRLERKLEAETAGGRRVVVILCLFPIGFLLFYAVAFREGANLLFFTFAGQCVLVAVMALVYYGVRTCQKIVNIEI